MKPFAFLFFVFTSIFSVAQVQNHLQLSIDQIMKGDDFVGYLPTDIEWVDNSEHIYFSWNPVKDTIRSTYSVDIHSKVIKKLSFEDLKHKPNNGDYSKDFKWKVYEKAGDLFLMNTSTFVSS